MISQKEALALLNKYEKHLNELQNIITTSYQNLLRCDAQIIPNALAALKAIANNTQFVPVVATSGMSSIKALNSDPQIALKELLVNDFFKDHFQKMCIHYAKDKPELLTNLQNF
nr:Dot/Icm T4SS effector Ceg5 [Legionella pneumophila]